jgi:Flp pilus assembly protein TadG
MPTRNLPQFRSSRRKNEPAARGRRRGVAVVELACLLPLLVLLLLITIDFARVFYFSLTLTNCARAGALYACDPVTADESPFPSTSAAALADAKNLSPQPTIKSAYGTDSLGRQYVEVSANYTFQTLTGFAPIPSQIQLTRTVRMFMAANTPNTN